MIKPGERISVKVGDRWIKGVVRDEINGNVRIEGDDGVCYMITAKTLLTRLENGEATRMPFKVEGLKPPNKCDHCQVLKSEVKHKDNCLKEKNRLLAGLGIVWCDGGCTGGVEADIDEETVALVERNTKRLRAWWTNKQSRDYRA